jgi:riboflavin kinase / FMN adenylyltransferase
MRRFDGHEEIWPGMVRRPVVTIGVFDGVHRGHRLVLDATIDLARRVDGEPGVLTFGTHPRAIIAGRRPRWLASLDHRLRLFDRAGMAFSVVLPFDEELRSMTGDEFVERVLVERIGVAGVVLGFNSQFGKDRSGDRACLERNARRFGFQAVFPPDVLYEALHISSTAIRDAVEEGRIEDAAAMLGRPVSLLGRVTEGDGRGRTLGFPTANLALEHEVRPPAGVYAGRVQIDGKWHLAISNIGIRPTFREGAAAQATIRTLVEVHVLDYAGDLYGRALEVHFISRIRDEHKFPSVDALKAQIEADRATCLDITGGRAEPDGHSG